MELVCTNAHLGCPCTTLRDRGLTAHEQIFCEFTSDEVKAQQGNHCPITDCPLVAESKGNLEAHLRTTHDICDACEVALTYPHNTHTADVRLRAMKDDLMICSALPSGFDFHAIENDNLAILGHFSPPMGLKRYLCAASDCYVWCQSKDTLQDHAVRHAWCNSCAADDLTMLPMKAHAANTVEFKLDGETQGRGRVAAKVDHFTLCAGRTAAEHAVAQRMATFLAPFLTQAFRPSGAPHYKKSPDENMYKKWEQTSARLRGCGCCYHE